MESSFLHKAKNYVTQLHSLAIFFGVGLALSVYHVLWHRLLGQPVSGGRELLGGLYYYYIDRLTKSGQFEIAIDPRLSSLRGKSNLILAANHPSLLDVVMVGSQLPEVACIMKGSLIQNPSMGGGATIANYVTNDSGTGLIRQGRQKLLNGETLLIFPEGTRTQFPAAVNPFKKGCALLAVSTDAEVQTLLIEHEGHYLGKAVPLLRPFPIPVRFRVHLGKSFQVEPGENARQFSDRLESYFSSHLKHTPTGIYLADPEEAVHSAPIAHASREPDSCHPSAQL